MCRVSSEGTKRTFAVNSVVINICSADIGSKLRTCNQQAPYNRSRDSELKPFIDTDFSKCVTVYSYACV